MTYRQALSIARMKTGQLRQHDDKTWSFLAWDPKREAWIDAGSWPYFEAQALRTASIARVVDELLDLD